MAANDTQRWKEKYLALAEQQDARDKDWQGRLDLLRRGLVRTSMAAEGSDPAVDQCMGELRTQLRQNDNDQGMAALIPRLEKIVLHSEEQRPYVSLIHSYFATPTQPILRRLGERHQTFRL